MFICGSIRNYIVLLPPSNVKIFYLPKNSRFCCQPIFDLMYSIGRTSINIIMDQEKIDMKLLDFIAGGLSPEKEEEIDAWINESKENTRYYEQMQTTYLQHHWFFRKKLVRKQKMYFWNIPAKRRRLLYYAISSAASVLFIIGLIATYPLWNSGKRNMLQYTSMIQPGSSKAELYLSSGRKISLGEDSLRIREEDNIEVSVNTPGEIDYSGTKDTLKREIFHRLVVERGGEYQLVLADSSVVWLNSASELEFPVAFTGNERRVKLKGEAYFRVKANPESPFIVEIDKLVVKATGTEFNINTHWNNIVETVLVKGKVNVRKGAEEIDLKPSQKAVYDKLNGNMYMENVNVEKYIAWRNGDFIFEGEPLGEIMDKLSLWYDFDVFFTNPALRNIRLSGDMKRYDKITYLLFYFEESTDLKFDVKEKIITVRMK